MVAIVKLKRIVIIAIKLVLIAAALMLFLTISVYYLNFGRRFGVNQGFVRYAHRQTSFYSGQNRLNGFIFGEDNDKGLIVISHGLGGGGLSYLREIRFFVDSGWRVFTFDKTASYTSEGRGTRGLPQSAIDLNAALNYIKSQEWELPIMLYGHSWGGYAVTAVLNFDHDICAVVSIAGFAGPMIMLQEAARVMMGPFGNLARPYLWALQQVLFGNYAGLCAVEGINRAGIPVMLIHGQADNVVSYSGAGIIAQGERINNPYVLFVSRYYPDFSGHNDVMLDHSLLVDVHDFFARSLLLQN